jgi:thiol-disulfide isomerase/thioredoxin
MASKPLHRRLAALLAATCVAVGALAVEGASGAPFWSSASAVKPLENAKLWVNAAPIAPATLQGKVVLLDFWTYSCINCLRTLPYVKAWARKYEPHGLVVIGVHTPEFGFERMPENVTRAARQLGIDFPVALDSERVIWKSSGVQGWPTMDFIDAKGRRRHRQLGEGGYEEAERVIQQLLQEAGKANVPRDVVTPQGTGTQAAPGPLAGVSDETYLGAGRSQGFASASGNLRVGAPQSFKAAPQLGSGGWTLGGRWQVADEHVELAQAGGLIGYRFRARDVHLVLGPSQDGRPVRFRLMIDGQAPGTDRGTDVAADGTGTVDSHRLYQLVRQADPRRERLFEIEFLDPGVRAYAFTFG